MQLNFKRLNIACIPRMSSVTIFQPDHLLSIFQSDINIYRFSEEAPRELRGAKR